MPHNESPSTIDVASWMRNDWEQVYFLREHLPLFVWGVYILHAVGCALVLIGLCSHTLFVVTGEYIYLSEGGYAIPLVWIVSFVIIAWNVSSARSEDFVLRRIRAHFVLQSTSFLFCLVLVLCTFIAFSWIKILIAAWTLLLFRVLYGAFRFWRLRQRKQ